MKIEKIKKNYTQNCNIFYIIFCVNKKKIFTLTKMPKSRTASFKYCSKRRQKSCKKAKKTCVYSSKKTPKCQPRKQPKKSNKKKSKKTASRKKKYNSGAKGKVHTAHTKSWQGCQKFRKKDSCPNATCAWDPRKNPKCQPKDISLFDLNVYFETGRSYKPSFKFSYPVTEDGVQAGHFCVMTDPTGKSSIFLRYSKSLLATMKTEYAKKLKHWWCEKGEDFHDFYVSQQPNQRDCPECWRIGNKNRKILTDSQLQEYNANCTGLCRQPGNLPKPVVQVSPASSSSSSSAGQRQTFKPLLSGQPKQSLAGFVSGGRGAGASGRSATGRSATSAGPFGSPTTRSKAAAAAAAAAQRARAENFEPYTLQIQ